MRFVLVCFALFALGAILRFQSGWLALPWQRQPSAALNVRQDSPEPIVLPPGMRETVLGFYERLDRGHYSEAFQISLENQWVEKGQETYAPMGLTSQADFVAALTQEWGANGVDLNVISVDVIDGAPIAPIPQASRERPELFALDSLPSGTRVEEMYEVQIGGSIMRQCSAWDWNKRLVVAKLSGIDGWRVLLPGIPDSQTPRLEEWFLDQNPFAKLRIIIEE